MSGSNTKTRNRTPAGASVEALGSTRLTRRSVTRAATWATPLATTSVAAPAFAASDCSTVVWYPRVSDLNGDGRIDRITWFDRLNPSTFAPIYGEVSYTGAVSGTTGRTGTLFDPGDGRTYSYIELAVPTPVAQGQNTTMTMTLRKFSDNSLAPVHQLSARIHEIDGPPGDPSWPWTDLATATFGAVFPPPRATGVIPSGGTTAIGPTFQSIVPGASPTVPWGNLYDLLWTGPISQVTFGLFAGENWAGPNSYQFMRVTFLFFADCPTAWA